MTELILKHYRDGRIYVGEFPECVEASERFIAESDPKIVKRDGDWVTFQFSNGIALYKIIAFDVVTHIYTLRRMA